MTIEPFVSAEEAAAFLSVTHRYLLDFARSVIARATRSESEQRDHTIGVSAEERNCTMSAQSDWLTATEAANYLRVKPRTLLLWARQGHIRGHVLSGTRRATWRFLRSDLDATLTLPSVALTKRRS